MQAEIMTLPNYHYLHSLPSFWAVATGTNRFTSKHLSSIISGRADIKHLLPVESIPNINAELLTVVKKVYKSPFVIDVMNITGT